MNRIIGWVLVIVLVLGTCYLILMIGGQANASSTCPVPILHRGYHSQGVWEDTLPAISKAKGLGPAEVDLRVTKDGYLMLMHNANITHATNGSGYIWDHTKKEMKALHTPSGAKVPTFYQAIRTAERNNVQLIVELKSYNHWTLDQIARAGKMATNAKVKVYLGGSGYGFERQIPAQSPEGVLIYWRPGGNAVATPSEAAKRAATMVMEHRKDLTREKVTALKKAGYLTALRLSKSTKRAAALGVDYMMTNTPRATIKYCRSI